MKNNSFLLVLAYAFLVLNTASCTKENGTVDATLITEQTRQEMQTALVGSWQLVEKGVEMAMHDGHICTDPANMAADKITYMTHWETTQSDEKRTFKSNGTYSNYVNATLNCQGTYTVSNHATLDVSGGCSNTVVRIEALATNLLIVKEGMVSYKYRKLD